MKSSCPPIVRSVIVPRRRMTPHPCPETPKSNTPTAAEEETIAADEVARPLPVPVHAQGDFAAVLAVLDVDVHHRAAEVEVERDVVDLDLLSPAAGVPGVAHEGGPARRGPPAPSHGIGERADR